MRTSRAYYVHQMHCAHSIFTCRLLCYSASRLGGSCLGRTMGWGALTISYSLQPAPSFQEGSWPIRNSECPPQVERRPHRQHRLKHTPSHAAVGCLGTAPILSQGAATAPPGRDLLWIAKPSTSGGQCVLQAVRPFIATLQLQAQPVIGAWQSTAALSNVEYLKSGASTTCPLSHAVGQQRTLVDMKPVRDVCALRDIHAL
jgi:hypothetical protein